MDEKVINSANRETESSVPVVVAFTPNYFIPVCVGIKSVLINSLSTDSFHFICLLTEDLPERMIDLLKELGDRRCTFSFLNLTGKLEGIYVDERYTVAASFRLLLPDLLPEYNTVLYMDCDIIVRNNIAELYRNTDLSGYLLAGIFEAPLNFQLEHLSRIGCNPGEYINSGFLLLNLELMRKDKMTEKLIEASKADYLEFPDQDVLNTVCKGKILGLSPIYNSIRTFFLPQYKSEFLKKYSEQDWVDVQRMGNIHYTGGKPWNVFTVCFAEWWKFYRLLPRKIRNKWKENKKLYFLSLILSTTIGRKVMNRVQAKYRKERYSKSEGK